MNEVREGDAETRPAETELPRARVITRQWRFPVIWLVPLVAALVAGYLMYDRVSEFGPQITLRFQDVSGVKRGQTLVKYRGVPIGEVIAIDLSDDLQQALVKVRLHRSAAPIARKDSVFWIVRPEVGLGNVSGLGTVISGPEIAVLPGNGAPAADFMGLDKAPVTAARPGLSIVLRTRHLGSLKANSPVYYRGVEVGVVQESRLAANAGAAEVRVLIQAPYANLVRSGSRFWKAGGIDVNFGLFKGLEVNVESLRALLAGGIAFATPPGGTGRPTGNGTVFPLFDKPEKSWLEWAPKIAIQEAPGP